MKRDKGESLEKWQSMSTISDYLGATRETVLQWIANKNMPAHKIGRYWKFKVSEIDEWIRSGAAADNNKIDEDRA